jgi:hypothetical protein
MSGPEHYREAERLVSVANAERVDYPAAARVHIAAAQVHATLALAAATAMPAAHRYLGGEGGHDREWAEVTA